MSLIFDALSIAWKPLSYWVLSVDENSMITIGIGSPTSTGGRVLEGNSGVMFSAMTASSVGHHASCPRCKKGIGPIIAVGPRTTILPAGPAARSNDYVECGCPAGSNKLLPAGSVLVGS